MVLIVFLLLPGILPSSWTFTQQLMNLTNPGIIIVIISAGLILRKKDGKHYIHFPEIARTGISWEMIIMLAAAYTIGSYLATEQTGFNSTLITFVQPMFEGKGSFFFYVVVLVITLLLTNILDNAVVGFAITPIAYNIAIAIGANPVLAVVIVVYFCELGFLFPASSASGALIHSNDKWISKKYVFSYAFIAITQSILAGIAFFLPLGLLIF